MAIDHQQQQMIADAMPPGARGCKQALDLSPIKEVFHPFVSVGGGRFRSTLNITPSGAISGPLKNLGGDVRGGIGKPSEVSRRRRRKGQLEGRKIGGRIIRAWLGPGRCEIGRRQAPVCIKQMGEALIVVAVIG